jgi:prephenate dehydrogenase
MTQILVDRTCRRQHIPRLADDMRDGNALIHGTGLIGASVGLGLRGAGWEVRGWDPDPEALAGALARGAISSVVPGPGEYSDDADLIVLSGPLTGIVESLGELRTTTLVTDVAGVKMPVIEAARGVPHFVGGHPMAGGSTSGAALATSHLFHGATWVLTTDNASEEDLTRMEGVVNSLGANPLRMTASEHDEAVARISHLPHILAAALMSGADERSKILAGGGFRDLTRVAASETGWWTEVIAANSARILEAIGDLEDGLAWWRTTLEADDSASVTEALDEARRRRVGLGEHHRQVRVVLFDRPGEIATVGQALEASGANVRDFQLRHGEHGGGGILTISVTPSTVDRLRSALHEMGLTLDG